MNASDQWGAIFRTFSSQSQSEYGSLTIKGFICSELSPQKNYYGGCWSLYIYSIMINLMNVTLSYLKTDCLLILFLAWFLPSFSFHQLKVNNHSSTQFRHQFWHAQLFAVGCFCVFHKVILKLYQKQTVNNSR